MKIARQDRDDSPAYARWPLMLLLAGLPTVAAAVVLVQGDLLTEGSRLEAFSKTHFGEGSNNYVAPTGAQWNDFRSAALALWQGDVATAEGLATGLDYEVLQFTDTSTGTTLLALRSRETNGLPVRGWGTCFVNTGAVLAAQIQVPHPQWDFRTPMLGAEVFLKSGARGLLIAGAHRHVNGTGTGDPCDLTNTAFHAAHSAWSGGTGENTAWQIHGFSPSGHPEFPVNAQAVLSTGEGGTNWMSTNVARLDRQLEWNRVKAYAYNRNLETNSALNLLVNEGVDGQTFTNLGARSNVQGIHSRGLGGTFVHVELATPVRTNALLRTQAADAIANAVALSFTNLPAATNVTLTNAVISGSSLVVGVRSQAGRAHQLEIATALATTNWAVLYTFPGQSGVRFLTNSPGLGGNIFLRVRVE